MATDNTTTSNSSLKPSHDAYYNDPSYQKDKESWEKQNEAERRSETISVEIITQEPQNLGDAYYKESLKDYCDNLNKIADYITKYEPDVKKFLATPNVQSLVYYAVVDSFDGEGKNFQVQADFLTKSAKNLRIFSIALKQYFLMYGIAESNFKDIIIQFCVKRNGPQPCAINWEKPGPVMDPRLEALGKELEEFTRSIKPRKKLAWETDTEVINPPTPKEKMAWENDKEVMPTPEEVDQDNAEMARIAKEFNERAAESYLEKGLEEIRKKLKGVDLTWKNRVVGDDALERTKLVSIAEEVDVLARGPKERKTEEAIIPVEYAFSIVSATLPPKKEDVGNIKNWVVIEKETTPATPETSLALGINDTLKTNFSRSESEIKSTEAMVNDLCASLTLRHYLYWYISIRDNVLKQPNNLEATEQYVLGDGAITIGNSFVDWKKYTSVYYRPIITVLFGEKIDYITDPMKTQKKKDIDTLATQDPARINKVIQEEKDKLDPTESSDNIKKIKETNATDDFFDLLNRVDFQSLLRQARQCYKDFTGNDVSVPKIDQTIDIPRQAKEALAALQRVSTPVLNMMKTYTAPVLKLPEMPEVYDPSAGMTALFIKIIKDLVQSNIIEAIKKALDPGNFSCKDLKRLFNGSLLKQMQALLDEFLAAFDSFLDLECVSKKIQYDLVRNLDTLYTPQEILDVLDGVAETTTYLPTRNFINSELFKVGCPPIYGIEVPQQVLWNVGTQLGPYKSQLQDLVLLGDEATSEVGALECFNVYEGLADYLRRMGIDEDRIQCMLDWDKNKKEENLQIIGALMGGDTTPEQFMPDMSFIDPSYVQMLQDYFTGMFQIAYTVLRSQVTGFTQNLLGETAEGTGQPIDIFQGTMGQDVIDLYVGSLGYPPSTDLTSVEDSGNYKKMKNFCEYVLGWDVTGKAILPDLDISIFNDHNELNPYDGIKFSSSGNYSSKVPAVELQTALSDANAAVANAVAEAAAAEDNVTPSGRIYYAQKIVDAKVAAEEAQAAYTSALHDLSTTANLELLFTENSEDQSVSLVQQTEVSGVEDIKTIDGNLILTIDFLELNSFLQKYNLDSRIRVVPEETLDEEGNVIPVELSELTRMPTRDMLGNLLMDVLRQAGATPAEFTAFRLFFVTKFYDLAWEFYSRDMFAEVYDDNRNTLRRVYEIAGSTAEENWVYSKKTVSGLELLGHLLPVIEDFECVKKVCDIYNFSLYRDRLIGIYKDWKLRSPEDVDTTKLLNIGVGVTLIRSYVLEEVLLNLYYIDRFIEDSDFFLINKILERIVSDNIVSSDILQDLSYAYNLTIDDQETTYSAIIQKEYRIIAKQIQAIIGGISKSLCSSFGKDFPIWNMQISGVRNSVLSAARQSFDQETFKVPGVPYQPFVTDHYAFFWRLWVKKNGEKQLIDIGRGITRIGDFSMTGQLSFDKLQTAESCGLDLYFGIFSDAKTLNWVKAENDLGSEVGVIGEMFSDVVSVPISELSADLFADQRAFVNALLDRVNQSTDWLMFVKYIMRLQIVGSACSAYITQLTDIFLDTTNFHKESQNIRTMLFQTVGQVAVGGTSEISSENAISERKQHNDTFGLLQAAAAKTALEKQAVKMLLRTPKLIFKSTVEQMDPNIRLARTVVDLAKIAGKNIPIAAASMALLPINVFPFPMGIGPPITPFGWAYLGLTAIEEKENAGKPTPGSTVFSGDGSVNPDYRIINEAFPLKAICERMAGLQPGEEATPAEIPPPGEEECRLF